MRGVGDQLALGAHRLVERRARALEPLEHRVEARGELADLVVGVDPQPVREVVGLADLLGGLSDLGERREHAAGGDPTERGRERDPAGAQEEQDQPEVGESTWSTPSSGRASWSGRRSGRAARRAAAAAGR